MYDVKNEGILPAVSLDAMCTYNFELNGKGVSGSFSNMSTPYPAFFDSLHHSATATLPCFQSIDLRSSALPVASADMKTQVSYYVWPFTCSFCKRHQTFL
jgi:hypothetical protein